MSSIYFIFVSDVTFTRGSILTLISAPPTTLIVVKVVLKTGLPLQKQRVTLCNICRHLTVYCLSSQICNFRYLPSKHICVKFSNVTCLRIIFTLSIKCTTYDEPSKIIIYEFLFASQILANCFFASFCFSHLLCPTYKIHLILNFTYCFKGNTFFICSIYNVKFGATAFVTTC